MSHLNIWKSLKMSHLSYWILAFCTNFLPFKTNLSGNTVWPHASVSQKLAKLTIFVRSLAILWNDTFCMIFKHSDFRLILAGIFEFGSLRSRIKKWHFSYWILPLLETVPSFLERLIHPSPMQKSAHVSLGTKAGKNSSVFAHCKKGRL